MRIQNIFLSIVMLSVLLWNAGALGAEARPDASSSVGRLAESSERDLKIIQQLLEGHPVPMDYPVFVIREDLGTEADFNRNLLADYFHIAFLRASGRLSEAEKIFAKWPDRSRWPSRMWLLEVDVLREEYKTEAALERCKELVKERPDYMEARILLAELLTAAGKRGEAIEALEAARASFPKSDVILTALHREYGSQYRNARNAKERNEALAKLARVCEDIVVARPGRGSAPYLKVLAFIRGEMGEKDKAIESMEELIRVLPRETDNYVQLSRFILDRDAKDRDRAREALRRGAVVSPRDPELIREVRAFFLNEGAPDGMLEFYADMAREYPGRSDLCQMHAEVLIERGEIDEAVEVLRASLKQHPRDAEGWLMLARCLAQGSKREEAGEAVDKWLAVSDRNPESLLEIVRVLLVLGDHEKARKHTEELRASSVDPSALEQIEMLIHRQAGNREELINSFKRAIERDPSRANIYGQMVESLMEMNRTEEALGFLSQAMEKVPENQKGTIREMRIIAHRALKDYDSAIAVTREAIENEPENWRLGLLLVSLYRQSERPEEMGAALDALLEKHKSNPMVQYQLAMTFWEKKDYPQVETALRAALDLDPDFVEALNSLGYLFAERNANLEEALELVQKALKLKPNAPHILDSMGWVYHQMGQYEKAVDFLEKASNNGEPDPVTLEHLGSAYQNLGRTKDALKTFRLALDKAKDEQKENIEERIRKLEKGMGDRQ